MQAIYIILVALSFSFCYVEYVHSKFVAFGKRVLLYNNVFIDRKPFNCVKCLTGWLSMIAGIYLYGLIGLLLLPVGVFAGYIFSCIQMRWL